MIILKLKNTIQKWEDQQIDSKADWITQRKESVNGRTEVSLSKQQSKRKGRKEGGGREEGE